MTSVDVPATLRALRASLDLTQAELAEKLGVSFATVNRWEGGSTVPQKAARETIEALARKAGVEPVEDDGSAPALGMTDVAGKIAVGWPAERLARTSR